MADGHGVDDAGLGARWSRAIPRTSGDEWTMINAIPDWFALHCLCFFSLYSFLAWAVARRGARLDGKRTRGRQGGPSRPVDRDQALQLLRTISGMPHF